MKIFPTVRHSQNWMGLYQTLATKTTAHNHHEDIPHSQTQSELDGLVPNTGN